MGLFWLLQLISLMEEHASFICPIFTASCFLFRKVKNHWPVEEGKGKRKFAVVRNLKGTNLRECV